jgi:AhpD family alkylhydroperoxidase
MPALFHQKRNIMEQRMKLEAVQPAAIKALMALETYLHGTELQPLHKELVKLRASQINGCAYCLEMHTEEALLAGETPRRISLLNAWEESNVFSAEEKAILALTDQVTRISMGGVTDAVWDNVRAHFTETYTAQLLMAIIAINAWNRVAVTTRMQNKEERK